MPGWVVGDCGKGAVGESAVQKVSRRRVSGVMVGGWAGWEVCPSGGVGRLDGEVDSEFEECFVGLHDHERDALDWFDYGQEDEALCLWARGHGAPINDLEEAAAWAGRRIGLCYACVLRGRERRGRVCGVHVVVVSEAEVGQEIELRVGERVRWGVGEGRA